MKPVFVSLLFVSVVLGQKVVTPGRPTAPGFPTTPTNPTTNPNIRNNTYPPLDQSQQTANSRPIFVSGKVTMDDGTPPPDLVRIEKICGASPRPEGYTDSKGRFSFQLDSNLSVVGEASDSRFGNTASGNSRQASNLMGCDLRAVLPGFRSDTVSLTSHFALDNPNVGTIVLHRLSGVVGTTISYASLNAPKDAQHAYEKGRDLLKKEKLDDAEKQFRKAVELYPSYATAWYELGRIEEGHKQPKEAAVNYRKSIDADSKYIPPYMMLSSLTARDADWAQTLDLSEKVIKLNAAEFPQAYFFNAVANLNLRHLEAAEKSAREAQKLDSRKTLPRIDQLLGVILLEKQDYPGAAKQMRAYLEANPQAQDASRVKAQLAELDKLSPPSVSQQQQP